MLERIVDGRTDLVFDYLAAGHAATAADADGTTLVQWCAYYGDVSALHPLAPPAGLDVLAAGGNAFKEDK